MPEAAGEPVDKVIGPARRAGTTVAKPLHLMEPPGQYASGQVCNGSSLPGALKWKLELRRTASWGPGTPQLTPADTSGGCPPSHESVTVPGEGATGTESGPRVCAAAASRLPSASVQAVIAEQHKENH